MTTLSDLLDKAFERVISSSLSEFRLVNESRSEGINLEKARLRPLFLAMKECAVAAEGCLCEFPDEDGHYCSEYVDQLGSKIANLRKTLEEMGK